MPTSHQHITHQRGWDDDYFIEQASLVGTFTTQAIGKILQSKIFHEQAYTSCLGILRLGKQYGKERLEASCQRALTGPTVNYGMIANILKKNLDKVSTANQDTATPIPQHHQVRGPQAYQ